MFSKKFNDVNDKTPNDITSIEVVLLNKRGRSMIMKQIKLSVKATLMTGFK